MRDDVDEQENECASYENRPCLAALAQAALSNPQPSHVTTVRPGCIQVKLGGFMMVSSLPAGPASTSLEHHNGFESMRSEASHSVAFFHSSSIFMNTLTA